MKISVENLKKVTCSDPVWGPNVVEEYHLLDVQSLYTDRNSDPLYRLRNAEIMAALFLATPIPTCRFVVEAPVVEKTIGQNIYDVEDRAEALQQAMEALGAEIELGKDEYPDVESLLIEFAKTLGVTNIAISRRAID